MAETLADRIMAAADAYAMAFAKAVQLDAYTPLALHRKRDLRALADRADAAERLARAADALEAAYRWHRSEDGGSLDDHQAALGIFHEALAAWRAVGE